MSSSILHFKVNSKLGEPFLCTSIHYTGLPASSREKSTTSRRADLPPPRWSPTTRCCSSGFNDEIDIQEQVEEHECSMISVTGGMLDSWLMQHIFAPTTSFLVKKSARSNFFWSYVFYLGGLIFIVQNHYQMAFWYIWVFDTCMLMLTTMQFKREVGACRDRGILPTGKPLISLRALWIGLTLFSCGSGIIWHDYLFTALGLTLQVSGAFAATHLETPGKSLFARVKEHVSQLLRNPGMSPIPSGA
jgi:hypothetical protein